MFPQKKNKKKPTTVPKFASPRIAFPRGFATPKPAEIFAAIYCVVFYMVRGRIRKKKKGEKKERKKKRAARPPRRRVKQTDRTP